jgi:hypothetical protein
MSGIERRQHERGLRVVELGCNRLHFFRRQACPVEHDRKWISAEDAIAEDVDRDIRTSHHPTRMRDAGDGDTQAAACFGAR